MSRILDITDLHVTFSTDKGPINAVDGVSLHVEPGRVLAVVGESGSGKTVTARSVLGLLPETATASGAVVLTQKGEAHSNDVLHLANDDMRQVRGRDVAMVFQEASTALNPVYTIGWQIAEGLRAHKKLSKKEARQQAISMLDKVG